MRPCRAVDMSIARQNGQKVTLSGRRITESPHCVGVRPVPRTEQARLLHRCPGKPEQRGLGLETWAAGTGQVEVPRATCYCQRDGRPPCWSGQSCL